MSPNLSARNFYRYHQKLSCLCSFRKEHESLYALMESHKNSKKTAVFLGFFEENTDGIVKWGANLPPSDYFFKSFAPSMIACTTVGSCSVEVSPKLDNSSSATLRNMRRMILPDLVLGRSVTN